MQASTSKDTANEDVSYTFQMRRVSQCKQIVHAMIMEIQLRSEQQVSDAFCLRVFCLLKSSTDPLKYLSHHSYHISAWKYPSDFPSSTMRSLMKHSRSRTTPLRSASPTRSLRYALDDLSISRNTSRLDRTYADPVLK